MSGRQGNYFARPMRTRSLNESETNQSLLMVLNEGARHNLLLSSVARNLER